MKLMFVSSGRPLSEAAVRLDDGRVLTLDAEGRCELPLSPGRSQLEIYVDGEWIERTLELDDVNNQSMRVIDLCSDSKDPMQGLVGRTLGARYAIKAALGHGGMGVVYRARDTRLERDVAIKVLNAQLRSDEDARLLFLQEARQMAPLSHPHLVPIYDVTTLDGLDLMITELIDGQNLSDLLGVTGPMQVNDVLILGYQLTVAVAFLHEQGVIHRDLKPANAILESGGGVKLIDFGLARSLEQLMAKGTAVRGTPVYMAPEQVLGPGPNSATDIYQLGVTLYELLADALPIDTEGNILSQIQGPKRRIRSYRSDVPQKLANLVHRCMAQEPADRPTADELATELADIYQARTSKLPSSNLDIGQISSADSPVDRGSSSAMKSAGAAALQDTAVSAAEGQHSQASSQSSAGLPPGELLATGQLLEGRYRIGDGVGEGAFGTIFRALDEKTGRTVAVKTIPPSVRNSSETAVGRFQREMKVIGNLDHPNIISLYDWGRTDSQLIFMILEFIDGETLDEVVRAQPMSLETVVETTRQLALGIGAAHRRGVIHRDLKPTNVMLVDDDSGGYQVKVLDFGMAKLVMPLDDESIVELTREGVAVGTPRYIAPEQARGNKIGPMTDLYAVGLLTYEMFTGVQAVQATTVIGAVEAHVSKKPLDLDHIDAVPPLFRPVLYRLLEKDPKRRFQSSEELLEALEKLKRSQSSVVLDASSAEVGPALGDMTGDFPGAGKAAATDDADPFAEQPLNLPSGLEEPELDLDYDKIQEQPSRGDKRDDAMLSPVQKKHAQYIARAQRDHWFRPPRGATEWAELGLTLVMIPLAVMMVGAQAGGLEWGLRVALGLAPTLLALGWAIARQTGDWGHSFGRRGWVCCLVAIGIAHLLGPTQLATELTANPTWFLGPMENLPGIEFVEGAVTWVSRHWAWVIFTITGH